MSLIIRCQQWSATYKSENLSHHSESPTRFHSSYRQRQWSHPRKERSGVNNQTMNTGQVTSVVQFYLKQLDVTREIEFTLDSVANFAAADANAGFAVLQWPHQGA